MGRARSLEETNTKYAEQVSFLNRSAELFDSGVAAEADRMAVSLRVLFHDTSSCTSLLSQLSLWDISLKSFCCGPRRAHALWNDVAAISLQTVPMQVKAVPRFLHPAPPTKVVPARDWWSLERVIGSKGTDFSRVDIVLSLANKDGAHVDPRIDEKYDVLNSFYGFKTKITSPWAGSGKPVGSEEMICDMLRAGVRHIAFEFLTSIR